MNARGKEAERMRNVLAIGVWDDEGGAPGRGSLGGQYGRRIEADRSWTVYHVFSGVPARSDGRTMIGLSRLDATDGMLSLNRRNDERGKGGAGAVPPAPAAGSRTQDCPS